MKKPPTLQSIEQFLFEVPLYAPFMIPSKAEDEDQKILNTLYRYTGHLSHKADGYCRECHQNTTFTNAIKTRPSQSHRWL